MLYDFVLLPPLETLSSQTLQQALLSSVAFTTKYSQIPLVIHLAIVSHQNANTCSLMQTHVIILHCLLGDKNIVNVTNDEGFLAGQCPSTSGKVLEQRQS